MARSQALREILAGGMFAADGQKGQGQGKLVRPRLRHIPPRRPELVQAPGIIAAGASLGRVAVPERLPNRRFKLAGRPTT